MVAMLAACTGRLGEHAGSDPAGPPTAADGRGPDSDDGDGTNRTGPTPAGDLPECEERDLPGQPLRRLSSRQYENTLRDLFPADVANDIVAGSLFPRTVVTSGFVNDAEANVVNTAESNAIEDNAERIAGLVVADPER